MGRNAGRRHKAEPVDGLMLLNKPAGITSNQALQKVKRLLNAKKAGHTGSLDPAATGMLPLCFGEATKVCAYLLEADKTYRATARLGEATDTADADGEVIETAAIPSLTYDDWAKIVAGFVGDIEQVPPMYSALKKDGKRLYELARQGITVERPARKLRIFDIQLLEARGNRLVLRVHCSKGTYIRTLIEDIAKAAGTLAHTASLHRESLGDFRAEDMLDLPTAAVIAANGPQGLRDKLLPADIALASWSEVSVDAAAGTRFSGGQSVPVDDSGHGLVKVYNNERVFLGVGELSGTQQLAPKRIFHVAA